jgi:hypothetical protein
MMIYIFYTHKIVVGLTPMALRYRSLIRYTPFSPHMRRVKYGVFKNLQKILFHFKICTFYNKLALSPAEGAKFRKILKGKTLRYREGFSELILL